MAEHERNEPASSWRRWTASPDEAADDDIDDDVDDDVDDAHRRPADDTGTDDDVDLAELLPAVPLLPSIAGRVDALDGQLRAISMRLDVLGSAVSALRTSIADRIDAYAEAAASATRQADEALDEHRRATQRSTADLRKGIAHNDEALRRLLGVTEEVATDVASVLDAVGDLTAPTGVDLRPLEATLNGIAAGIDAIPLPPDLHGLETAIDELGDVLGRRLATAEQPPVVEVDLAPLRELLDELEARIEARLARAPVEAPAPGPTPLSATTAPAVDLVPLERALADVRTLVEVVVDTMPASAEGTGADLADRVAAAVVARLDIDELARQVAERLRQHFEVVTEDEA